MTVSHYIKKKRSLSKKLDKYLLRNMGLLAESYGNRKADSIIRKTRTHYQEIIPEIPYYATPAYDSIVLIASRMLALKKAMRDEGLGVEEFAWFIVSSIRKEYGRIPLFVRRLGGRLFLSRPVQWYMKRAGISATRNGWPTEVTIGSRGDSFDLRIRTTGCGMLRFVDSAGEGDLRDYCSAFDFAMAEAAGVGLRQVSTIDSEACVYEVSRKGRAEWPEAIRKAMTMHEEKTG